MKKIDAFKHGKMVEAYFQPYLDLYYEEYYEKYKHITNAILQRKGDVDRIAKWKDGRIVSTEDKYVVDKNYTALFIETDQNTTLRGGSKGWIYISVADELVFTWCNAVNRTLRINHLNLKAFREWFFANQSQFYLHRCIEFSTEPEGRLVPVKDIPKDLWIRRLTVKY